MPRINLDHFTVEQFRRLCYQACTLPDNEGDGKTEFLWLDVACIDQNDGPQKVTEIGMQAAIFYGA